MQKFILPAFRLVAVRNKTEAVKFSQKPLAYKTKFDRFCALNVKSKMHHVAVLNDVVLAF